LHWQFTKIKGLNFAIAQPSGRKALLYAYFNRDFGSFADASWQASESSGCYRAYVVSGVASKAGSQFLW
jgi:hypothetical protein